MAYLVGALVDISGSMKENSIGRMDEEGGEWAKLIVQVIDDLIKHDVSSQIKVCSLVVGASCGSGVFDILSTIQKFHSKTFKRGMKEQPCR